MFFLQRPTFEQRPLTLENASLAGSGVALLTSLAWAVSSICVKRSLERSDSLFINTLRTVVGAFLLILYVVITGRYRAVTEAPAVSLVLVILSGLLAMVLGDTIYIKGMSLLDVSLAFPLSQVSFILLAVAAAALFLGEPLTWTTFCGAGLVISGIYLMTTAHGSPEKNKPTARIHPRGLFYIFLAVLAWTGATLFLKMGVVGMDPFLAAAVRISTSALMLSSFFYFRRKASSPASSNLGKRYVLLIVWAGFLTYGVAAVGYIKAMQWIGAGKTVLLTATAPVFVLPLAVFFLGERPTRWKLLGVLISLTGVCLVVI